MLGTMSIPHQLDLESTVRALGVFSRAAHVEVDTAIMYADGHTAKTLGERNRLISWGSLEGGGGGITRCLRHVDRNQMTPIRQPKAKKLPTTLFR